jgi:uncharacterized membrane protein
MQTTTNGTGTSQNKLTQHPALHFIAAWAIISIFTFLFYFQLFPEFNPGFVPWGSDTFGHIYRFEFLRQSIAQGVLTPRLFPDWYLGIQLFRYYPPMIYYPMAMLSDLVANPIYAANLFLIFTAWLGASFFLLFKRWLGYPFTVLGGVLHLLLPDLTRVAFAEGNLLRAFSSALFPLVVFLLIRSLESFRPRRFLIGMAVVMHMIVLTHPMMAAIQAALLAVLILVVYLQKLVSLRQAAGTLLYIVLGILSASWWLIPSLAGGITTLSAEAVIAGLARQDLISLFNPFLWQTQPEQLYLGLSLLLIPLFGLLTRSGRDQYILILLIPGLLGSILVLPGISGLFFSLPFSHLLWPARFLAPASFLLLLAAVWWFSKLYQHSHLIVILLAAILTAEMGVSLQLVHLNPPNTALQNLAVAAGNRSGWRSATLDDSRLGSAPSYYLSADSKKEQVFGWAFQGAASARVVASLNEAVDARSYPYLLDRLNLIGVDQIVRSDALGFGADLPEMLISNGYQRVNLDGGLELYARPGGPRGTRLPSSGLAIGTGAQNYAYHFPQIYPGGSVYVDDYSLKDLSGFQVIVLSGFTWHNRAAAEELIRALANQGTTVVVDLTNTQEDVLAQTARFEDVWAEPIILDTTPIHINRADQAEYRLRMFDYEGQLWHTFSPQGLDAEVYTFDYLGQEGVAAGFKQFETGRVWYVGLNLAYHAVVTPDPQALAILSEIIGLPVGQPNDYEQVDLQAYQADGNGVRFSYELADVGPFLIPVSYFDNFRAQVDGIDVPIREIADMVVLDAPAGRHQVQLSFVPASSQILGILVSALATLVILLLTSQRQMEFGAKS